MESMQAGHRRTVSARSSGEEAAAHQRRRQPQAAYAQAVLGRCQAKGLWRRRRIWLPTWQGDPHRHVALRRENRRQESTVGPGGALARTSPAPGGRRRPVTIEEKCVRCLRCWFILPRGVHQARGGRLRRIGTSTTARAAASAPRCVRSRPIDMIKGGSR
ncbi:MAG: hypothetical protein MZV70_44585 [Desulfobacterales bacterium]|nr:hypothetical protein [Desulfobacterales bacterium]